MQENYDQFDFLASSSWCANSHSQLSNLFCGDKLGYFVRDVRGAGQLGLDYVAENYVVIHWVLQFAILSTMQSLKSNIPKISVRVCFNSPCFKIKMKRTLTLLLVAV